MGRTRGKGRVGVTHFPLAEEQDTQRKVPPRGSKKDKGPTPKGQGKSRTDARPSRPGPVKPKEERTIPRRGAKGGKTSGSRAGLVSYNKRKKRT